MTRTSVWVGIMALVACGGGKPEGGTAAEGGTGDETTATASATTTGASMSATSGMQTDTGQSGTSGSAEESSGGSGTAGGGPGIELGCMGMGGSTEDDGIICFFDIENPDPGPAANVVYKLVDFDGTPAIHLRVIFAPWFVDNTYGETAINWPNGHKFGDLVGSDHVQIIMRNMAGDIVLQFKLDYVSDDMTAPSGYRCLGVWDGEGRMEVGDETAILAANSSISRNLNERGYGTYIVDSPETDEDYSPNADAPNWDFRYVYEVWVDAAAFDDEGDGALAEACVQVIHASPSKLDGNTVEVFPDECPPGWGCFGADGCTCDSAPDPDGTDECDPTEGVPPEG